MSRFRLLVAGMLGCLLAASVLALVLLRSAQATPAAAQARAVTVTCGQVITANTAVSNDLVNCPDHGLVIGADGITLDLNRHTIDGGSTLGHGVFNPGFDNVRIRDGTLTGFIIGVELIGGSNSNRVNQIRAVNSEVGIRVIGGTNTVITNSTVDHTFNEGISIQNAPQTQLTNSASIGNRTHGITVVASPGTVISGAKAVSNDVHGIRVDFTSRGVEIRNSIASSNGESGIWFQAQAGKLTGNIVVGNTLLGIDALPGVVDGNGNRAHDNGSTHQCEFVVCT